MEIYRIEHGYWRQLNSGEIEINRKYGFVVEKPIVVQIFKQITPQEEELLSVTVPRGFLSETNNIVLEWLYSKQKFDSGDSISEYDATKLHLLYLDALEEMWKKYIHMCYWILGIKILNESWQLLGCRGPEFLI